MKAYEITLLTPAGIKKEIYKDSQPLSEFEDQMKAKYGTFITQSCKELISDTQIKDLFETPELIPAHIKDILNKHSDEWDDTYDNCRSLENELKENGYLIDWGLSAEPYNLRKI